MTHRSLLLLTLGGLAGCRDAAPPGPPPPIATTDPMMVSGPDSLLGLLQLGGPVADGSGLLALPLQLRAAPSREADTVVTITRWQDVVAEEIDYETPALAIWRAAAPWYLVATQDGVRGWIELPQGGSVTMLAALLPNRLTYLTPAWDGTIRSAPDFAGAASTPKVDRTDGEASVSVAETRLVEGTLWVRIALHASSPCDGTVPPAVVAEGWVPAWTAGRATVWYYSRGC